MAPAAPLIFGASDRGAGGLCKGRFSPGGGVWSGLVCPAVSGRAPRLVPHGPLVKGSGSGDQLAATRGQLGSQGGGGVAALPGGFVLCAVQRVVPFPGDPGTRRALALWRTHCQACSSVLLAGASVAPMPGGGGGATSWVGQGHLPIYKAVERMQGNAAQTARYH